MVSLNYAIAKWNGSYVLYIVKIVVCHCTSWLYYLVLWTMTFAVPAQSSAADDCDCQWQLPMPVWITIAANCWVMKLSWWRLCVIAHSTLMQYRRLWNVAIDFVDLCLAKPDYHSATVHNSSIIAVMLASAVSRYQQPLFWLILGWPAWCQTATMFTMNAVF